MTDINKISQGLYNKVQSKSLASSNDSLEVKIDKLKGEWTTADSAADEAATEHYNLANEDFNTEIANLNEVYNQEESTANVEYESVVKMADEEVNLADKNAESASKNYEDVLKNHSENVSKAEQNLASLEAKLASVELSSSEQNSFSSNQTQQNSKVAQLQQQVEQAKSELENVNKQAQEAIKQAEQEKNEAEQNLAEVQKNAEARKKEALEIKEDKVKTAQETKKQGETVAKETLDKAQNQANETSNKTKAENRSHYEPQIQELNAQKQYQTEEEQKERQGSSDGIELAMAKEDATIAYESAKKALAEYEKVVDNAGIVGTVIDKANYISPFKAVAFASEAIFGEKSNFYGIDSVEGFKEKVNELEQLAKKAEQDYNEYVQNGTRNDDTVKLNDKQRYLGGDIRTQNEAFGNQKTVVDLTVAIELGLATGAAGTAASGAVLATGATQGASAAIGTIAAGNLNLIGTMAYHAADKSSMSALEIPLSFVPFGTATKTVGSKFLGKIVTGSANNTVKSVAKTGGSAMQNITEKIAINSNKVSTFKDVGTISSRASAEYSGAYIMSEFVELTKPESKTVNSNSLRNAKETTIGGKKYSKVIENGKAAYYEIIGSKAVKVNDEDRVLKAKIEKRLEK